MSSDNETGFFLNYKSTHMGGLQLVSGTVEFIFYGEAKLIINFFSNNLNKYFPHLTSITINSNCYTSFDELYDFHKHVSFTNDNGKVNVTVSPGTKFTVLGENKIPIYSVTTSEDIIRLLKDNNVSFLSSKAQVDIVRHLDDFCDNQLGPVSKEDIITILGPPDNETHHAYSGRPTLQWNLSPYFPCGRYVYYLDNGESRFTCDVCNIL